MEKFGAIARETLSSCKKNLVGHSSKNLEDQNTEINAVRVSLAHEVSGGNKDSIWELS